jgi:hypothetical protein
MQARPLNKSVVILLTGKKMTSQKGGPINGNSLKTLRITTSTVRGFHAAKIGDEVAATST